VDEALSQLKGAVKLDPLSALYNTVAGYLYYLRGEYDLAIAQYQRAMDLDPAWYLPHLLLAIMYEHIKKLEEGISEAQKACELSGDNTFALGILGLGYGLAGRSSEARTVLEELTAQRHTAYVPPYAIAAVCKGLGEMEQALEWLEKGIEERDMILVAHLKSDPRYIVLQGQPRYHALLRKMNMEP
jgi:tetratricopeptide (TPR) repeat protein